MKEYRPSLRSGYGVKFFLSQAILKKNVNSGRMGVLILKRGINNGKLAVFSINFSSRNFWKE